MAKTYVSFYTNPVSVTITAKFRQRGSRKPVVGPVKEQSFKVNLVSYFDEETSEFIVDAENLFNEVLNNKNYTLHNWVPVEDLSVLVPVVQKQIENGKETFVRHYLEQKRMKQEAEEKQRILEQGKTRIAEVCAILEKDFSKTYVDEVSKMRIAKGEMFYVYNGGMNLGRSYNKYCYLVFLNGNQLDKTKIPSGNEGNYSIGNEGVHPILGKYIETSCCVDSGD